MSPNIILIQSATHGVQWMCGYTPIIMSPILTVSLALSVTAYTIFFYPIFSIVFSNKLYILLEFVACTNRFKKRTTYRSIHQNIDDPFLFCAIYLFIIMEHAFFSVALYVPQLSCLPYSPLFSKWVTLTSWQIGGFIPGPCYPTTSMT